MQHILLNLLNLLFSFAAQWRHMVLGVIALLVTMMPCRAQTMLWQDEFNSTTFDTSAWNVLTGSIALGRAQFGNQPRMAEENGVQFTRLPLDTYNPSYPGGTFKATAIYSKANFKLGSGVEFEARLRGKDLPRGMVVAFFPYRDDDGAADRRLQDEIDYEFLTNWPRNQVQLHVWNDWHPRYGYNGGVRDAELKPFVSGLDWSQWNTYKIRWLNDRTEWYVNGVLVFRDSRVLPDHPLHVDFNIWVPDSSWAEAYDGSLQPTSSSSNRSYYLDVDYVRVQSIAPAAGAVLGTGDGLAATYYNNTDFTAAAISRIDPRVYFDWGHYFETPTVAADTFSVRWTGQVQAQYSQNYTFTTRSDDGVRLWVNGQRVIDNWTDHSVTENSVSLPLTAGVKYNIQMDYYESGSEAVAQLLWSSPSTPRQPIPQSQLYSTTGPLIEPGPTPVADTTPPTLSLTRPRFNYSYRTLSQATGTASDTGGSNLVQVRGRLYRYVDNTYWNGSAWGTTASELTASGLSSWTLNLPSFLADGRYAFRATAVDGAGNTAYSANVDFYIDTVAPSLTIYYPSPNAAYNYSVPEANGVARDAIGVAQVRGRLRRSRDGYYWSGSAWVVGEREVVAQGTTTWKMPFPTLSSGTYTFQAIARDWVGNIRYSAPVTFTVSGVQTFSAKTMIRTPETVAAAPSTTAKGAS